MNLKKENIRWEVIWVGFSIWSSTNFFRVSLMKALLLQKLIFSIYEVPWKMWNKLKTMSRYFSS